MSGGGRFIGGGAGAVLIEGVSMGFLEDREHSGLEIGVRSTRAFVLGGTSAVVGAKAGVLATALTTAGIAAAGGSIAPGVGTAIGAVVGFIVGLAVGAAIYYIGDRVVPGGREDWDAMEAGCQPRRSTTPTVEPPEPTIRGCFAGGTRIECANGVPKPIEQAAVGDMILAHDENTGTVVPARVSAALCHGPARCLRLSFSNGNFLDVTANHPLREFGGDSPRWTEVGKLAAQASLVALNAQASGVEPCQILDIREIPHATIIYDISVETHHNFFANGILAHNKNI